MSLSAGTRIGPYEIISSLGAGGMGEVYRARDSKLNRDVALKILPESFSGDPDRLARFRREAQVLAALNHSNIGHIYGFEDSGRTLGLVLELVPGPTLADRIAQGPVPVAETRLLARQIAEALEAAHEHGIVHRDLKPANIKISDDGTVKVLDFGLAKAIDSAQSFASTSAVANVPPTMTSPAMTQLGIIFGTAAYMSPEQASGKPVDKRADIWAFGVVVWEMLTGHRLFDGDSVSETLASVLKDQPRLDALPSDTPPELRRLLSRCLERDPKLRLRDIGEARILLSQPPAPVTEPRAAESRRHIPWLAAAAVATALAITAAALAWSLKPATPVPHRRFELPAATADSTDVALSPDGTSIAYLAGGHLYVRPHDAIDARDLGPVHATSNNLFWSPDSRTIGFTAEAMLRSIPAAGGAQFVICKIPASGRLMGYRWLPSGTIVFSVWRDSLYKVPATGGTPTVHLAVNPAAEIDFHHISALPDERLIVSTHQRKDDFDIVELVDGQQRIVLSTDRTANLFEYAGPGWLLFRRITVNAGLWAVPFKGGPVDFTKAVLVQAGANAFNVADDGTVIAELPAAANSSLVWVDRSGAVSPIPGPPVEIPRPEFALSPDGRRAAFITGASREGNVTVRDLESGRDTRLTFNKAPDRTLVWSETRSPAWFPSGDRILHMTGAVEAMKLVARTADAAGEAQDITAGVLGAVTSDGGELFFLLDDRGRGRLRRGPLGADGTLGPARAVFPGENEPNIGNFALSRDGRLLAYVTREPDSSSNLFLTRLPAGSGQWLVAENAVRPRFGPDGRELFYLRISTDAPGQTRVALMLARLTIDPAVTIGAIAEVFNSAGPRGPRLDGYDISPDGRRFLMSRPAAAPGEGTRIVLIQNWQAVLRH